MNNVAVASGNPDYSRVTQWLAEAWSDVTFEQLGSSSGMAYVTLDPKLASANDRDDAKGRRQSKKISRSCQFEDGRRRGDIIKGRQIVWMLLDSFKTFDCSSIIYGFDHLSALKLTDGDLHEFIIQWNYVLGNMGDVQMNTMLLRDAFYRKIEKVRELEYDMNQYERMHETDPRHMNSSWTALSLQFVCRTKGETCLIENKFCEEDPRRTSATRTIMQFREMHLSTSQKRGHTIVR